MRHLPACVVLSCCPDVLLGDGTPCYPEGCKPYRMVDLGIVGSADELRLPGFGDFTFGFSELPFGENCRPQATYWSDASSPNVNTLGHIVAYGSVPGSGSGHAFLLTCPTDFNGDYLVTSADLGLLLAAWSCSGCSEDLTGDGTVDGEDVSALLADWSSIVDPVPCTIRLPEVECPTSPSLTSEQEDGPLSFDEAIEALGFASGGAFAEWSQSASVPSQKFASYGRDMILSGKESRRTAYPQR
ncbi:MAG: hypothetical protein U0575_06970 [Phycisphaerales bacterium]